VNPFIEEEPVSPVPVPEEPAVDEAVIQEIIYNLKQEQKNATDEALERRQEMQSKLENLLLL